MRSAFVGILEILLVFAPGLSTAQGKAPVLAVFEVEDQTKKLRPGAVQQLTSYLSARFAAGGAFRVIPSSQLKERLVQQKRDSYKGCYDQKCQIDIGRELAADRSVSTQIIQLGSKCAVLSTLYDLKQAATERSASEKSGCAQDDLVAALEKVVEALKGQSAAASPVVRDGILAVRSEPLGAAVFVDGQRMGETPGEIKIAPGMHSVRLELRDRTPAAQEVSVQPGQLALVSIKLALSEQARRRIADAEEAKRRELQAAQSRIKADRATTSPSREDTPQISRRRPIYKQWVFWTLIGAAVVGGTVGAIAATTGGSSRMPSAPDRFDATTFGKP
jgi:hypothetical protein